MSFPGSKARPWTARSERQRERQSAARPPARVVPRRGNFAFTLIELMVVVGIMVLVLALLVPAMNPLKAAGDVTAAAFSIKGVLEQARSHAVAANTYTWVGFFEEDGSKASTAPATPGVGRLVMSVVASSDGTNVYGSSTGVIDPTKLRQVGKLIKIDNVHLPLFEVGTGTGDSFDTRPTLQNDLTAGYNYSRFGELNASTPHTAPYTTPYRFQYPLGNPAPTPQYVFTKLMQFSPRGEARVNGDSYQIRRVVEIGLIRTHGASAPAPASGGGTSTATYSGNVVALQISGFGGDVKIYRR